MVAGCGAAATSGAVHTSCSGCRQRVRGSRRQPRHRPRDRASRLAPSPAGRSRAAVADRRGREASAILSAPRASGAPTFSCPYEAHLPAQEAQARPDARLPCAHEHARRSHRAEAPSRQGPQAAHGLVSGRPTGGRTPKRRRLSRSAEFERVYRQGRSKANRFLVLYAFPRGDDEPRRPRIRPTAPASGLSVSRRVGGAVDRTRVKRVLREAFWAEAERLPPGADYVVVARPGLARARRAGGHARHPHRARGARRSVAARKGRRRVSVASPHRPRARPRVPALHLAGAAAALQVPPDLLGLRGAGRGELRHTARGRPGRLACAPLQPVQPRWS